MNKPTRTIYLKLEVDWEDYNNVHPQLILEDALPPSDLKDGVRLSVIKQNEVPAICHNITRVEVIESGGDNGGRKYVNMNCKNVFAHLQDNDRTLKVFLENK